MPSIYEAYREFCWLNHKEIPSDVHNSVSTYYRGFREDSTIQPEKERKHQENKAIKGKPLSKTESRRVCFKVSTGFIQKEERFFFLHFGAQLFFL